MNFLKTKTIEEEEYENYFNGLYDEYSSYDDNFEFDEISPQEVKRPGESASLKRKRSDKQKERAKRNSSYKCEYDPDHETFLNEKGDNFIECHHLIPLSNQDDFDYSIDVFANIVCLCPLCHRIIHHAAMKTKKNLIKKLYEKRKEFLRDAGVYIDFEDLLKYYK